MTESIESLQEQIKQKKTEIKELKDQIHHHPDYIRQFFDEKLIKVPDEVMKKITFIERTSGWTDSRKNPMQYEGIRFDYDGKSYEVMKGSNWCSEVHAYTQIGKYAPYVDIPHSTIYSSAVKDYFTSDPVKAVASLLMLEVDEDLEFHLEEEEIEDDNE